MEMTLRLKYIGSYTSAAGLACMAWKVMEGRGRLRAGSGDWQGIFVGKGDEIQITREAFWGGENKWTRA